MVKVLVVDDDQDLRDNLMEVLTENGFSANSAENGEIALEKLQDNRFDLVLLDSVMPVMDGLETLPLIKRTYPKTRVIMLTAFSTVNSAVEAMRSGADDYITKPFKIDELLVAIRRCLEEAKFGVCEDLLNSDDMFKCLANATRRKVLLLLDRESKLRFMDLTRKLDIDDHTKVNFHLKSLKEAHLIEQDRRKNYQLSAKGKKIVTCMSSIASS